MKKIYLLFRYLIHLMQLECQNIHEVHRINLSNMDQKLEENLRKIK